MQRVLLDLSKTQLSKLRNGHNVRILPHMFGSGVDMIIDPMTFHNMAKKLEKGKGVVMGLSNEEIEANEMEGSGLMMSGSGNKSGKINRLKKAKRWRDFSVDTAKQGIDTAKYGYEQFQSAVNPIGSKVKSWFGGEMDMEMEGEGFLKDIKKGYNRKVKNSKLGSALRKTTGNVIGDVYDRGAKELGKNKYGEPLSQYMKTKRGSNVKKITGMSGLGLRVSGEGKVRPAVVRPNFNLKHGKGLKMAGGACEMCQGSGMQNDKFLFNDSAL